MCQFLFHHNVHTENIFIYVTEQKSDKITIIGLASRDLTYSSPGRVWALRVRGRGFECPEHLALGDLCEKTSVRGLQCLQGQSFQGT